MASVGRGHRTGQRHLVRSEIAASIAAAVAQQGTASQEISRNIAQAAGGTTQVATSIVKVDRRAAETESASNQMLTSARDLARDWICRDYRHAAH